MRTLSYEDWYDKIGNELETEIENAWYELPEVFIRQFKQDYIDDKIQDALIEGYELYTSEYEDMAYENFKESRLGCL